MSCVTSEIERVIKSEAVDSSFCTPTVAEAFDDLANELVREQEKTPEGVILKGSKVIRIYDGGCS